MNRYDHIEFNAVHYDTCMMIFSRSTMMRRARRIKCGLRLISAISICGCAGLAHALSPDAQWFTPKPNDSSLSDQRYHYELAKSALKQDDTAKFDAHYALLGDYPLIPYLDYSQIKQNLYQFDFTDINRFLETNKGTFLEYRLREQLLHSLAMKRRWDDYLAYDRPDIQQKGLLCHRLSARLATGDKTAMSDVAELWVGGKSHPKACDPLFKKWRKQGGLDDDIAWTRFHNAMANGKRSLARYVSGLMGKQYKAYANEYLGVHAYPGRIKQHRRFSEQSLKSQQIISHGIKRFSRIDPKQALKHWERYEAQQLFPKEISTDTKVYLVKQLTYKGFTEKAESLINNSQELRQQDVVERLLREALRNEQFEKVIQWLAYLDDEARAINRWQYWKARAQDEIGRAEDKQNSINIYKTLAKQRSFYGFLASDKLDIGYTLGHKPSMVMLSTRLVVQNKPAIQRAKELWLKGNVEEARAEWQFATNHMSSRELAAAGHIARQWGWYNKGIHAMIRGNMWDDLDVRFPLAYRDTVEKASSISTVETTLIYAIARQESAFATNARSSAGARGLMQLMPSTARQTARKSGIKHRDSFLYDPEYNIQLGSRYLNELLGKYNGNRILAAAAYNAGPHRVNTWIKKTSLALPFDVWIETIPFKETRGYVQNILAFSVIYAHQLGQERDFITANELTQAGANP